jgi:glycosyltransferase involved in cell wall biosynthesis
MSRGIPTVVSNIEIFREIGAEAAIFFDQESPESFAEAVKKLESNPRWLEASSKSIQRAHDFNWDKSAADLIELINQLKSE